MFYFNKIEKAELSSIWRYESPLQWQKLEKYPIKIINTEGWGPDLVSFNKKINGFNFAHHIIHWGQNVSRDIGSYKVHLILRSAEKADAEAEELLKNVEKYEENISRWKRNSNYKSGKETEHAYVQSLVDELTGEKDERKTELGLAKWIVWNRYLYLIQNSYEAEKDVSEEMKTNNPENESMKDIKKQVIRSEQDHKMNLESLREILSKVSD